MRRLLLSIIGLVVLVPGFLVGVFSYLELPEQIIKGRLLVFAPFSAWMSFTLGMAIVLLANWEWVKNRWLDMFDPWVPMPEAVDAAFRELHGTLHERNARREPTEDERRNYMATFIANEGQVFGRRPPALHQPMTTLLLAAGNIVRGGQEFRIFGNESSQYFDLRIKHRELKRTLQALRVQADGIERIHPR